MTADSFVLSAIFLVTSGYVALFVILSYYVAVILWPRGLIFYCRNMVPLEVTDTGSESSSIKKIIQ